MSVQESIWPTIRQTLLLAIALAHYPSGSALAAPVTLKDLESLQLKSVSLSLSPDGQTLAMELSKKLTIVNMADGRTVRTLGSGFLPTWSPRSQRLAFYSTRSGQLQIWEWDQSRATPHQLTHFPGGISPDLTTRVAGFEHDALRFAWSPDGSRIVFASRTRALPQAVAPSVKGPRIAAPLVLDLDTPIGASLKGVFAYEQSITSYTETPTPDHPIERRLGQLFVANISGGALTRLTHGRRTYFHPTWSPDGTVIGCVAIDSPNITAATTATDIVAIDAPSGVERTVVSGAGVKARPEWVDDGRAIAFMMSATTFAGARLFVASTKDGHPTEVTQQLDRNVWNFSWEAKTNSFVVDYNDGSSGGLIRIERNLRESKELMSRGDLPSYAWAPTTSGFGAVAWLQMDATDLRTIQYMAHPTDKPVRVVNLIPEALRPSLGKLKAARWRNSRGDQMVGAILVPPDFHPGQAYPLIVDAYPLQGLLEWEEPLVGNHAWASMGYVVFRPAPRSPGTWMVDPPFSLAGKGAAGWGVTVDDVMSGVDELVRQGIADSTRMCLFGHSAGGGVVNYLVTRTDRFRCAVSVAAALSDWVRPSLLDPTNNFSTLAGGKTIDQDPNEYIGLSAVFHLNDVKTPMLLAVGDKDWKDFLLDQIEMYNGLRRLGKDVTLVRYPDQGHILSGDALRDFWNRESAFFHRYLQ